MPHPLAPAVLCVLLARPSPAQEAEAKFDAPLVVHTEYQPAFRQVLDFNADGHVDALGYDRTSTGSGFWLAAYLGNGTGVLTQALSIQFTATGTDTTSPRSALGSFGPSDDLDDFVVTVGDQARVYRGRSSGVPFEQFFSVQFAVDALDVAAGDFDGDGFGDFAVLLAADILGRGAGLQYYRSGPDGALTAGPVWPLPAGEFDRVELFTFRGDPLPALFLAGPHRLTFRSPRAEQKTRRAFEQLVAHGCAMPMAAVGDADGDGDDDVTLFEMDGRYRLLRQGPSAALELEGERTGGPATDLADVDGDGDLDGVCCGGGSSVFNYQPTNFEIALNDGAGGFAPAFKIPGLGAQHIGGVADLDEDGDVELLAGRVIYYSRGGVRPPIATPFDDGSVAERALADMDADGDIDYLDTATEPGIFHENQGDGRTVEARLAASPLPPSSRYEGPGYPGDFDGDGTTDLLVERWDDELLEGLHLLRNVGGSHLEDAGRVAMPSPAFSQRTSLDPRSSLVADLDGDGRLDLVVRDRLRDDNRASTGLAWVWFNDLPAGFTAGPRLELEQALQLGDLDGDGTLDLVVARDSSVQHLWWRRGLGGRAFGALEGLATTFGNGYFQYARDHLALARLPGRSWLEPVFVRNDVAATSFDLYHAVYEGTDRFVGRPLTPPSYESISQRTISSEWWNLPMRPFCPDLDATGTSDLVYGKLSTAYNGVAYWQREAATGTYHSKRIQLFMPLAFADVDGDGDPDGIGTQLVRSEFIGEALGGTRLQYGQGTAGAGGYVPELGASGPFRPGRTMQWRISGGLGGAQVTLVFGRTPRELADSPVTGVTSYVDPAGSFYGTLSFVLDGPPGVAGAGTGSVTLVPPSGHSGTTEYLQALIVDPAAAGGLSATRALRIRWGD